MDQENFEKVYRQLSELLQFGGNAYMSEALESILTASGAENLTDEQRRDALLDMQLASGQFLEMVERHRDLFRDGDESAVWSACAADLLTQQTRDLPAEDRRAALVDMIEKALEIAGEPLSEENALVLGSMTDEELESGLKGVVIAMAQRMMEQALPTLEDAGKEDARQEAAPFMTDAAACAAYTFGGNLSAVPQQTGMTAAAAAATAELSRGCDPIDVAQIAATMAMTVGIGVVLCILGVVVYGTAIYTVDTTVLNKAKTTLAELADVFVDFLKVYAMELKVALGVGAAGVLTEAAVQMRKAQTVEKLTSLLGLHAAQPVAAPPICAEPAGWIDAAEAETDADENEPEYEG